MIKYDPTNPIFEMLAFSIRFKKYLGDAFKQKALLAYCIFVSNDDYKDSGRIQRIKMLQVCFHNKKIYSIDNGKLVANDVNIDLIRGNEYFIEEYYYFCQIKALKHLLKVDKKDAFLNCSEKDFVKYVELFKREYREEDYLSLNYDIYSNLKKWTEDNWKEEKGEASEEDYVVQNVKMLNLFIFQYDENDFFDERLNTRMLENYFEMIVTIIKAFLVANNESSKYLVSQIVFSFYLTGFCKYSSDNGASNRYEQRKKEEKQFETDILQEMSLSNYSIFDKVDKQTIKCGYLLEDYVNKIANSYDATNQKLVALYKRNDSISRIKKVLIDCLWSLIIRHEKIDTEEYIKGNVEIGVGTHPLFKGLLELVEGFDFK